MGIARLHALLAFVVVGISDARPFPGFVEFPDKNLTQNIVYGALGPEWEGNRTSTARMICDAWADCDGFDGMNYYYFADAPGVDSYVSINTCGGGGRGVNESGFCVPGGAPGSTDYWYCPEMGPAYEKIVHYVLPPFSIAKACNELAGCIAFTIEDGNTTGTLYRGSKPPNTTAYPQYTGWRVKKPKPSASNDEDGQAHAHLAPVTERADKGTQPARGFVAFRGYDLSTSTQLCVGCPPLRLGNAAGGEMAFSTGSWAGETWVAYGLSFPVLGAIAHANAAIDAYGNFIPVTFIDQPTRNNWTLADEQVVEGGEEGGASHEDGGAHQDGANTTAPSPSSSLANSTAGATIADEEMPAETVDVPLQPAFATIDAWFFKNDTNATSYISMTHCIDEFPIGCGVGIMMRCAGLNTSAPLVLMETYDLPPDLMAKACAYHDCHVFVMHNQGNATTQTGSLYRWPPSTVPNVTVNGFFRMPSAELYDI